MIHFTKYAEQKCGNSENNYSLLLMKNGNDEDIRCCICKGLGCCTIYYDGEQKDQVGTYCARNYSKSLCTRSSITNPNYKNINFYQGDTECENVNCFKKVKRLDKNH